MQTPRILRAPATLDNMHYGADYFERTGRRLYATTSNQFTSELFVMDLDGAMKPGATCTALRWEDTDRTSAGAANLLLFFGTASAALDAFLTLDWSKGPDAWGRYDAVPFARGYASGTLHRHDRKAAGIFSPFASPAFGGHIKPLTERPAKWTKAHLLRALMAGQATDLRTDYYYTDDYAYDAATNFGKGMREPLSLAREIVDSASNGWHAYDDRRHGAERTHVGHHSFLSLSFVLDLGARLDAARYYIDAPAPLAPLPGVPVPSADSFAHPVDLFGHSLTA